ncbi:flagellar biosynthesis anti-sigma factor FlgM [Pseudomonas abieticivorans]|uniref:flagellar biosynthesis anti-sigma factor FlgM n=1 Tax=Pseudomonas abieticivorans TaxID=2931382 RepID=UPI0020C00ACD|nr:flagellar biosynthesis anti-sigma factor FlgM [Pseudomonas sp. PIA16]
MKIISTPLSNTLPNTDLTANARLQRSEASETEAAATTTTSDLEEGLSFSPAAASDIDMDRVNEIRQALSEGTLQISSARISEGLASSVLELSGETTA